MSPNDDFDIDVEGLDEGSLGKQSRNYEEEAKGMGWNPDYEGEDAIGAKEFVQRKPLYDEMKKLRRKSRELENAIQMQRSIQDKLLEKQREELISQLEAKKKGALEEGNAAEVLDISKQIEKVEKETATQQQSGPPPGFDDFIDKNPWYESDPDMKDWADQYGARIARRNPNTTMEEIYNSVTKRVREVFPHKFQNPNRERKSAVERSQRGGTEKNADEVTWSDVPREYRRVAEAQWRAGAFGEGVSKKDAFQKYAEELKTIGAI